MEVVATGAFDDIRSQDVRFLEECSKLGKVALLVWDDESVLRLSGKGPRFPVSERLYLLQALRFVSEALAVRQAAVDALYLPGKTAPWMWADTVHRGNAKREAFCKQHAMEYRVFGDDELKGFPTPEPCPSVGKKRVIVTGCYDWLHSGHIRFFEEVSGYGELYAVVGNDANIRALKGPGHPLLTQDERRYMVGSIRHVSQALIATGEGWLDAEPEIARLKPDIYAVNEDGDRGGKRDFCARKGIEYLVLTRVPAPGLPKRSSTDLRGF